MSSKSDTKVPEADLAIAKKIVQEFKKEAEAGVSGGGEKTEDLLIPLLQQIQEGYGYLPEQVLGWVSRETGIPTSRMHGVITFYSQFYTEPRGKHIIQCCRGTACHVKGASKIIDAVRQETGLKEDGSSEDMLFTLETVSCLGACALAPLSVVDDTFHGKMDVDKARKLVKNLKTERDE
ncbi:MAG: NAD(P)H-dependent oxidoreductase subunit E [Spirochaetia bacterium]|nr:NAD(P)H-dependent oxidoreductase subunit E [Spirochaetia bacterium]